MLSRAYNTCTVVRSVCFMGAKRYITCIPHLSPSPNNDPKQSTITKEGAIPRPTTEQKVETKKEDDGDDYALSDVASLGVNLMDDVFDDYDDDD